MSAVFETSCDGVIQFLRQLSTHDLETTPMNVKLREKLECKSA